MGWVSVKEQNKLLDKKPGITIAHSARRGQRPPANQLIPIAADAAFENAP
jgi:hypothetical protein